MLHHHVKNVGANGAVYLGKELAGKVISVEKTSSNTWVIRAGEFVPNDHQWLYKDDNIEKINAALEWAKKTPAKSDDFDKIMNKLENIAKSKNG